MSEELSQERSQSTSPQERTAQLPESQEDSKKMIVPKNESSKIARAKTISKQIARYYYRWPAIIAAIAILLNCMSTIEGIPLRWLLTGSSTLLIIMLVGHSGTRSEEPLQDIREAADRLQVRVDSAQHKADSALRKSTKSLRRSQKSTVRVRNANANAHEALRTANVISKVAHAANHSATSALQASVSSKRLSELSQEKSLHSKNLSQAALEQSKQALTRSTQSAQKSEIAVNQSKIAVNQSKTAVAEAEASLNRIAQGLKKMNANNVRLFQPFNRYLEEEVLTEFTDVWMPKLNIQINPRALGYLAHRICLIEDACSGRLAANVESMLLRILIARSVEHNNLSVLEIGSLFGISLGILYESCQGYFQSIHLTALDPLDGYYGQSQFDTITEVPVSRQIFEHNMQRLDIPSQDVTLIQNLSTEGEIVDQVNHNHYNLLVIDGDHSYEGVKFDFDHYVSCIESGGYIIFDDYESEYWPAIAAFVDKEVKHDSRVTFIGSSWKTAVFKVL